MPFYDLNRMLFAVGDTYPFALGEKLDVVTDITW